MAPVNWTTHTSSIPPTMATIQVSGRVSMPSGEHNPFVGGSPVLHSNGISRRSSVLGTPQLEDIFTKEAVSSAELPGLRQE